MTQSSVGFAGQVNDAGWAKLQQYTGSHDAVGSVSDLAVTGVTGNRRISVAAGDAWQDGVLTTLSAAETFDISTPTAGAWWQVVLRRVWSTKATSIQLLAGPTTTGSTPTAYPTSDAATFQSTPGGTSDQRLAWIWVNVSSTAVIVLDQRGRKASDVRRGTAAARDAYYGLVTSQVVQQNWNNDRRLTWYNTATQCEEQYFALDSSDLVSRPGLVAGSTVGWYPTRGALPECILRQNASVWLGANAVGPTAGPAFDGTQYTTVVPSLLRQFTHTNNTGKSVVLQSGRYEISFSVPAANQGGSGAVSGKIAIVKNSTIALQNNADLSGHAGQICEIETFLAYAGIRTWITMPPMRIDLKAQDTLQGGYRSLNSSIQYMIDWNSNVEDGRGFFRYKYVGPPFA